MLTTRADDIEQSFEAGRVIHAVMPPHAPSGFTSLTPPISVGISFSGHRRAARQYGNGAVSDSDISPGDAFVVASADLRWLDVKESSDALEVQFDASYLLSVARDLGAPGVFTLPDVNGAPDAIVWGIAASLRAALRGELSMSDVQASTLLLRLTVHVLCKHASLSPPRAEGRKLDSRRLDRVRDYIDANIGHRLAIRALAKVAAFSPYHFARSFRRATGIPPHVYVTARRMERARQLTLQTDLPTTAIAQLVGYCQIAHFRANFVRHFGVTPRLLRSRHAC